jgi:hypothetical protein
MDEYISHVLLANFLTQACAKINMNISCDHSPILGLAQFSFILSSFGQSFLASTIASLQNVKDT